FIVLGLLLMASGFFMGYKSIAIVNEEEAVNTIIKEIAKEQGLSDKFVPKVKGDIGVEMAFILLSLLGAGFFLSGTAGIYKRKKMLANYTIGEDPSALFHCSSKDLPVHKFPMVYSDRNTSYHLRFTDKMEGSVTDPSGNKYMLTELVQMGQAEAATDLPGTTDWPIPDNHVAELRMGPYKWIVSSVPQPKLVLPFTVPKEVFYVQLAIWIAVVTGLAYYANYVSKDELFSTDPDQQEVTVNTIIKSPDLIAKKKKEAKQQKIKDKDKQKDIYKKMLSKTKDKDAATPRDPRNKTAPGQGGAGVGLSRISGPQGMGVANVLASQISAMTASLTASNTVFGQETEDFDDHLGDSDPDGEAMDGGFGGRGGAGGGGGGGGLGIGGGGGTGFGGIGIGGGGGLGGRFGKMGGVGRRSISVRSGSAAVFGKLDPNEVRAVIRAHRREVHHCYQKGLMANDKLAGTVRVSFMINTTGRVQSCSVTENLAIPKVGHCICGRLTTWKFPQPQGGLARVAYAWTLQPGG
ncbi:AgmX/PglI C-terminal domain-containing protein, partial [Myxococcota bacterium]|nr:AgmX/PglI C-terminal domain-containing protein [Myxococcota bacterium]